MTEAQSNGEPPKGLPDDKIDYASAGPPKGALSTIFLIVFADLMGFGIIIPLLPLYAAQYQASALDIGLLFSVYSACQFIASPILGALSDRYGRRPVLIFSQLGSSLG
jgi:MFS transporter, DHA1 family, tetracycline resistance protein